ncbi:hypothetical protein F4677DRAFT_414521 [Hypoxylon crocopeplum]|nr:hypothetical protein F4677DRAFT_414521 [Hypoxylon crocopeplum]
MPTPLDDGLASLHLEEPGSSISTDNQELFVQKWNEALEQCLSTLNEADQEMVRGFGSPKALLEDLNRKAQARAQKGIVSPISQALADLKLQLSHVERVSHILLVAMRPNSIELGLLWGILYLMIELSLDAEAKWREMLRTLTRMARTLQRCERCNDIVDNDEFKDNLLAIFIAMIRFWASASRWMREHHSNVVTHVTEYLSNSFQATMAEMEDAVNTMEHCYSSRFAGKGQHMPVAPSNLTPSSSSVMTENLVSFPHWDLPHDNVEHFIGRSDALKQIHSQLRPCDSHKTQHFAIWGLGGVGKSQCALAYANKYQDDYDAEFWVRAESDLSLNQSFSSIAINLGLTSLSARTSPIEVRGMVLLWLRNCGRPWLVIFDNVENINLVREFMPMSPGSVLVTTRSPNIASSARVSPQRVLQLKALNDVESWSMFSAMLRGQHRLWKTGIPTPDSEVNAAKDLLGRLGGLPLGIRQMAALIRKKAMTVEKFLRWYLREAGNTKRIIGGKDFEVDPDYPFAVETVWTISFNDLEESQRNESSEAYILLATLGFLSPDSIPMDLFKQECPSVSFCGDEDLIDLEAPKEELISLALIDLKDEELSIHRLVQTTCLHHIEPSMLQTAFEVVCTLLNKAFPKQLYGRPLVPEWPTCLLYAPHVQSIAHRYEEFKSKLTATSEFLQVLSNCAWYLHEIGAWDDSGDMVRIAKSACPDKEGLMYSHLENTLGASTFELNELETCRKSLESALNIRRKHLEPGDEDLLCTINNYANLQSGSGHPEEALKLYDEVQKARETLGAETQIPLAITYAGKGQAMVQMQRFAETEAFYDKAYDIIQRTYGPEGHYIGHLHHVYGNMEMAKGDLNKAMEHFSHGLGIYRRKDPDHLLTACLLYKIGCIKIKEGKIQEASDDLREARTISQRQKSEANVARIARKLWPLLASNESPEVKREAQNLRVMAEIWERKVSIDSSDEAQTDKAFDGFLCLFFR